MQEIIAFLKTESEKSLRKTVLKWNGKRMSENKKGL